MLITLVEHFHIVDLPERAEVLVYVFFSHIRFNVVHEDFSTVNVVRAIRSNS